MKSKDKLYYQFIILIYTKMEYELFSSMDNRVGGFQELYFLKVPKVQLNFGNKYVDTI